VCCSWVQARCDACPRDHQRRASPHPASASLPQPLGIHPGRRFAAVRRSLRGNVLHLVEHLAASFLLHVWVPWASVPHLAHHLQRDDYSLVLLASMRRGLQVRKSTTRASTFRSIPRILSDTLNMHLFHILVNILSWDCSMSRFNFQHTCRFQELPLFHCSGNFVCTPLTLLVLTDGGGDHF
jgi:hypothetical protein